MRSKDRKLLKQMKFPKVRTRVCALAAAEWCACRLLRAPAARLQEYELKMDLKPVNWEAIKGWVAKRATELLGVEDEVLVAYIFEQIEGKAVRHRCSVQGHAGTSRAG